MGGGLDRFKAAIVDSIYVGIVNILITIVLLHFPINQLAITAFSLVIYLGYSVYLTVNKGRTFGKQAYGLKVVQYGTEKHVSYAQAFLREFMKNGPTFVPFIGVIYYVANGAMVIFSAEKRGWHDMLAGTQVLKTADHWGTNKQFVYIMVPLVILGILVMHLYSRPEFLKLSGAGM